MKRIILFLLLFGFFGFRANSQCNNELIDLCLKDIGKATYLKDFPVRLKKGKRGKPAPYARYVVALNKGTHYRFNIKNDVSNESFAIMTLADDYKVYGTTYRNDDKKNYQSFDFYCRSTGTYYLSIRFKDATDGCAVGMVSMVDIFKMY